MCLNLDRSANGRALSSIAAYGVIAVALSGLFPTAFAEESFGWRRDGNGEFKASGVPTSPSAWN